MANAHRWLLLVLLGAMAPCAPAQAPGDGIRERLRAAEGRERVDLLVVLCERIQAESPRDALARAEEAVLLARRLGYEAGERAAILQRGLARYFLGEYPAALESYEEVLARAEEAGDGRIAADALNNIGILHYLWGAYDEALDRYLRSLEIRRAQDDRRGLARSYNNLANLYHETGRHEEALEHYALALEIYETLGDTVSAADSRNNIGLVHAARGDHPEALEQYRRALELQEAGGDRAGIALTRFNMGLAYEAQGRLADALESYRDSLGIRRRLGDRRGLAFALHNVGAIHFRRGGHDEAERFLRDALEIASDVGVRKLLADVHESLATLYAETADPARALEHHREFKRVSDAIFNEENARRLAELQTRYEVAEKDHEIERLRHDREMREIATRYEMAVKDHEIEVLTREQELERLLRNGMIAGAVILLVILSLLYSRYRLQQRANREIRERNEALEAARAEVERAARAELTHVARVATLGELAAALAHELNQPLAAILSNAQASRRFLQRDAPPHPDVEEAVEDIASEAQRAREIIQRLRALLRRGEIAKEPIDVSDALSRVEPIARADARHYGVELSMDLAQGLPEVLGDRIQLQQVVLNLVHNGAEAMSRNGAARDGAPGSVGSDGPGAAEASAERDRPLAPRGRLVVRTARENGNVRVEVRDSGPPVPEETFEKMFEPFFTTKEEGLGMGLPICRTIIEAHGGRLWPKRNPGGGLVVQFTLPCAGDARC